MAQLSFFLRLTYSASRSRAIAICLRLYWAFLACMGLGIVCPSIFRTRWLLRNANATDYDRLIYDLGRIWEFSVEYLTFILIMGCIVGCSRRGPFRKKWTGAMFGCHLIHFIFDSVACWSTYTLLQSRGFDTILKTCQGSNPTEMNVLGLFDATILCRRMMLSPSALAIVAIAAWKLFTLSLILLTWIWLLRVVREDLVAKAMEGIVPPATELVEIAEEESPTAAEEKV